MFGRGYAVAAGGVHHDYAARGRRGNVNVVHAGARAAYDLEFVGRADDLGRDLGLAADDQGVIIADDFLQFFRLQPRVDVDLKPLAAPEQVYADLGKIIADQNFHNSMKPAFHMEIKNTIYVMIERGFEYLLDVF